jgi:hypothetical protein
MESEKNCPNLLLEKEEESKYLRLYLSIVSKSFNILGKKHQRMKRENSLEILTLKFIKYIISSSTNCINLKEASKALNIKRRRIYDITNVLEGKCYIFEYFNSIFLYFYLFLKA